MRQINLDAVDQIEVPISTPDRSVEFIGADGLPLLLPASAWEDTTPYERAVIGMRNGVYLFPTVELAERLREIVAGRTAIEIGAGNGVLAAALGIRATDSREQEEPRTRTTIQAMGQQPVRYGPNVQKRAANRAVELYRPQVVIGCWVTERYRREVNIGKAGGVDELAILDQVETYVLVGNERVHRFKAIWDREHSIEFPSFVVSRAANPTRDFIAVWQRER